MRALKTASPRHWGGETPGDFFHGTACGPQVKGFASSARSAASNPCSTHLRRMLNTVYKETSRAALFQITRTSYDAACGYRKQSVWGGADFFRRRFAFDTTPRVDILHGLANIWWVRAVGRQRESTRDGFEAIWRKTAPVHQAGPPGTAALFFGNLVVVEWHLNERHVGGVCKASSSRRRSERLLDCVETAGELVRSFGSTRFGYRYRTALRGRLLVVR
jgi:hypothetical protein